MDGFDFLFEHALLKCAVCCSHSSSHLLLFQPGWEERVHTDGRTFYIDHSKMALCHDVT